MRNTSHYLLPGFEPDDPRSSGKQGCLDETILRPRGLLWGENEIPLKKQHFLSSTNGAGRLTERLLLLPTLVR